MFTVEDHVRFYEKALARAEFLDYEMEAQAILGYLPETGWKTKDFIWSRSVYYEEYQMQFQIAQYNYQRVVELVGYIKARQLMPRG